MPFSCYYYTSPSRKGTIANERKFVKQIVLGALRPVLGIDDCLITVGKAGAEVEDPAAPVAGAPRGLAEIRM
jgi:hypothetical protein